MNNFGKYITPEEAVKQNACIDMSTGKPFTLERYKELAAARGTCENCDEEIWRMAGNGLCFSCTTGEADASDDAELVDR